MSVRDSIVRHAVADDSIIYHYNNDTAHLKKNTQQSIKLENKNKEPKE